MKLNLRFASLALLTLGTKSAALGSVPVAEDKLRVVATIPDLADIVREIGGDRVDVTTIAKGRENLHLVAVRPSHLVAMNRADVLVQVGLSLETGFVPGLLEGSRNPRIQPGKPGFVNTSEGWTPLDVPSVLDRKYGDVHPQGNPHMNMDPRGGKQMADRILAGLVAVDPRSKEQYERRYADYSHRLAAAGERWASMGKAWQGRKIVVYHKEYDYLAAAYGISILGAIEPKPGIPPTPNSVAELVERIQAEKDVVIVTAIWSNNQTVSEIASRTGAKVVELPNQCGGLSGTDTWIDMMDLTHRRLQESFVTGAPRK